MSHGTHLAVQHTFFWMLWQTGKWSTGLSASCSWTCDRGGDRDLTGQTDLAEVRKGRACSREVILDYRVGLGHNHSILVGTRGSSDTGGAEVR